MNNLLSNIRYYRTQIHDPYRNILCRGLECADSSLNALALTLHRQPPNSVLNTEQTEGGLHVEAVEISPELYAAVMDCPDPELADDMLAAIDEQLSMNGLMMFADSCCDDEELGIVFEDGEDSNLG